MIPGLEYLIPQVPLYNSTLQHSTLPKNLFHPLIFATGAQ